MLKIGAGTKSGRFCALGHGQQASAPRHQARTSCMPSTPVPVKVTALATTWLMASSQRPNACVRACRAAAVAACLVKNEASASKERRSTSRRYSAMTCDAHSSTGGTARLAPGCVRGWSRGRGQTSDDHAARRRRATAWGAQCLGDDVVPEEQQHFGHPRAQQRVHYGAQLPGAQGTVSRREGSWRTTQAQTTNLLGLRGLELLLRAARSGDVCGARVGRASEQRVAVPACRAVSESQSRGCARAVSAANGRARRSAGALTCRECRRGTAC